ncbi:MAG: HD-GYP domain-containing protein, partial [Moorellaceae bacterium]
MQCLDFSIGWACQNTGYLLNQLAVKDRLTAVHSLHVAKVASKLAEEMGLDSESLWLYEAGLLHDLGKLYVADELLSSRRVFSSVEKQAMQLHVSYTQAILKHYNYPDHLIKACY